MMITTQSSGLRRRHTWPFELDEIVCDEVHTDPDHPHFHHQQRLLQQRLSEPENDCKGIIEENDMEHQPPNEETRLLDPIGESGESQDKIGHAMDMLPYSKERNDEGENKNKTHNACTCSSKSSNNKNHHTNTDRADTSNNNNNDNTHHPTLLEKVDKSTSSLSTMSVPLCLNSNNPINCATTAAVTVVRQDCKGVDNNALQLQSLNSSHLSKECQNNKTFTFHPLPRLLPSESRTTDQEDLLACRDSGEQEGLTSSEPASTIAIADTSNSSSTDTTTKKSPLALFSGVSSFQPIQDKFSFLSKKNRDSRKKKQQKERENFVSTLSGGGVSLSSGGSNSNSHNNSSSTSTTVKHKDFCPHSKYQQERLRNAVTPSTFSTSSSTGKGNPLRKSDTNSKSSLTSKSLNTEKKDERRGSDRDCFTSTSSNNNSPSHSQHSTSHASHGGMVSIGSMGTSTQGILNKNGGGSSSMGSGASHSGSGLKGSVTLVTGNINCNMHHETEGKIPSANGTATGALSLQVNTANGEVKKTITLWQNYYPEGQWGWIVVFCALLSQAINHGLQVGVSTLLVKTDEKFHVGDPALLGLLASTSFGISLLTSPFWISFCKTKSTRLSGVFGGLLASLGCLFTSFGTQFHQLFFSYGAFIGVGVGLSRDASTLMVGQYFKRKREMVEIIVVSGSGLGILMMSTLFHVVINYAGWILGLQAVTGAVLATFFLATCYRSASLYHPQRRAILHLKNQKKKVKDITKREERPPFLDFSCLKSKTLQILLVSSAFIAFGINTPLIYLGLEARKAGLEELSFVLLHVYVGAAWILGCCLFGLVAVQKNQECRVSKQYLCQVASVICGISIIAFTAVKGYSGYVVFSWVYGFSLGGYNYALKVYTYERVRARHFARAWSFVQCSQAIPIFMGTPIISWMNQYLERKSGYYLSAAAVFIGSAFLFLTDVRRRRLSRKKANNSSMKTCSTSDATQTPKMRRLSFAFPIEPISPHHISKHDSGDGQGSILDPMLMSKELTCISEEGLAEIDFQDIYFEDWAEYLGGDCITSCNKVENCLASEYDPDFTLLLDKKSRRWSRNNSIPFPGYSGMGSAAGVGGGAGAGSGVGGPANISSHSHLLPHPNINSINSEGMPHFGERTQQQGLLPPSTIREIPVFRNHPRGGSRAPLPASQRSITVIDEASV